MQAVFKNIFISFHTVDADYPAAAVCEIYPILKFDFTHTNRFGCTRISTINSISWDAHSTLPSMPSSSPVRH